MEDALPCNYDSMAVGVDRFWVVRAADGSGNRRPADWCRAWSHATAREHNVGDGALDREVRGEPFFTIDKLGCRLGVYL